MNKLNLHKWLITLISSLILSVASAAGSPFYDMEGKAHTFEEYKGNGKWLIVMFWASDCHVCAAEAHQYVEFHKTHQNKDAVVLGVSLDGREGRADAAQFIKTHQLNFTNLIGEPEAVALEFMRITGEDWIGTPSFLAYGPHGELRARQVGAIPAPMIEQFIEQETAASLEGATTTKQN